MGKASRDKGKRGELEVAKLLRDKGFNAKRGVQHKGGPDSPDVLCAELDEDFHIEVKRVESFSLYKALDQARCDCGITQEPIVFHRRNGQPWVVVLEADTFLDILRQKIKFEAEFIQALEKERER